MHSILAKFYVILLLVLCRFNIEGHAQFEYKRDCDKYGIQFYEVLRCQANFKNATSCPHSYTCPEYVIPKGKCFYKGQFYNEGEGFDNHHCDIGCKCTATSDGKAQFVCDIVDCFYGTTRPGCYRVINLQDCCPREEVCEERTVTCKSEGKTYLQEQYFDPKDSCLTCVCKPGFIENHYVEPFCQRYCNFELHFRNALEKQCSPYYEVAYNSKLCCPTDFVCPDNIIKFEKLSRNVISGQGHEQCKFDSKIYNVGEAFQVEFQRVYNKSMYDSFPRHAFCECVLPPYFTCTQSN